MSNFQGKISHSLDAGVGVTTQDLRGGKEVHEKQNIPLCVVFYCCRDEKGWERPQRTDPPAGAMLYCVLVVYKACSAEI